MEIGESNATKQEPNETLGESKQVTETSVSQNFATILELFFDNMRLFK
jgi:hypothetical protein